jgi:hypothetical protein
MMLPFALAGGALGYAGARNRAALLTGPLPSQVPPARGTTTDPAHRDYAIAPRPAHREINQ